MATKYQQTQKHDPKTCFICLGLRWTYDRGWIDTRTGDVVTPPR